MPLSFTRLDIPDVVAIDPLVQGDDRGWFAETYKHSEFAAFAITPTFVQDNHSRSQPKNVLRGLHFQIEPAAQAKLVSCVAGSIFDVAVDIRVGSPTFGKWIGIELSAENHRLLWIPEGFAHGFCTLVEGTEVTYKVTSEYSPEHDRIIRWDDPAIGVEWPVSRPILSARDRDAPTLDQLDVHA